MEPSGDGEMYVAAADIKSVNAGAEWYDLAQDRSAWAAVCKEGIAS